MEDQTETSDSSHKKSNVENECHMPLSPVLGTRQSVRKLLKRKKRLRQDSSKVVQKLDKNNENSNTIADTCRNFIEEESCSKNDSFLKDFIALGENVNCDEADAGPSNIDHVVLEKLESESLLSHIRKLEELELQRINTAKAISFPANANEETEITPPGFIEDTMMTKSQEPDECSFKPSLNNKEESYSGPVTGPVNFQTGTGKAISISDLHIENSKKLFCDILNPTAVQTPRKKKYNYLHKNSRVKSSETGKFNVSDEPVISTSNFGKEHIDYMKFDENIQVKSLAKQGLSSNIEMGNTFGRKTLSELDYTEMGGFKNDSDNTTEINTNLNTKSNLNTKCDFKNIFVDENFDDLKFVNPTGFRHTSRIDSVNLATSGPKVNNTIYGETNKNLDSGESQFKKGVANLTASKRCVKNIFGDNLNFADDFEFKPVPKIIPTYVKSTFRTEHVNIENTSIHNTPVKVNLSSAIKVKSIFGDENFEDINFAPNIGFKPASIIVGPKSIQYTENKTKCQINETPFMHLNANRNFTANEVKATTKVNNIFGDENFDDLNMNGNVCFKPASTNMCQVLQKVPRNEKLISNQNILRSDQKIVKDEIKIDSFSSKPSSSSRGFKETLNTNAGFVKKPLRNIFEGENFDDLNLAGLGPTFQGYTTSRKNLLHNRRSGGFVSPFRTPVKNDMKDVQKSTAQDNLIGFTYGEQQVSKNIAENNRRLYETISDRYQVIVNTSDTEIPLVKLSDINVFSKNIWSNKNKCNMNYVVPNRKRLFSELDSDHNASCQNPSTTVTPLQNTSVIRRKKRLGCPFSPTIKVSEEGIKRAKSLFEDLNPKPIQTSTPIRFSGDESKSSFCNLTPIQPARKNLVNSFSKVNDTNCSFSKATRDDPTMDLTLTGPRSGFSLNKPSEGDVGVWLDNLSYERRILQEKLRIIDEKQTILNNQKTIMEFAGGGRQRIVPGVLYRSKQKQSRVSLQEFVKYACHGDNPSSNTFLDQINAQNAHLVHFHACDLRKSHLKTEDGAVIVPNTKSRIGISEIEHSFKLMEGVDPNLIPKGWIRNHYKWIIWKLASYERMFGDTFEGCLSVENVVQQLKYRYDVEIDNVRRSALRKIFEKDDCAQKRMILCVSKIMKVNNSYELELTDGWYPIRAVIDQPLSDQIIKGKIKLGIKLIIYGSVLVNCEGCFPLEATELIYIKINYNSTRRALWWCKLGFQKESGPFVIPMSSIHMEGGKIGCIRCYIYRIYPVKYLEKYGDKNVWRNRKAEERREQDFYNEKCKSFEKCPSSKIGLEAKSYKDIKNIEDPEVLYELLQKSGDPESLEEMLSSTQKTILYNYTNDKSSSAHYTTFNNFSNHSKAPQRRSVKSMLKMKVIDASCDADKVYDFHLWTPGESHLQELKEGEVVTIFNASCSLKWGLSANHSTLFRKENKIKDDRFQKFRRKVTYIEELQLKCASDEFDTVGLVIEKRIADCQEVWMANRNLKLLLIKVYDSPKNILVLDTVNEGQIISVCNLVFKHAFANHSFAVADHSVIFARYSQFKHLQDALEKLENDFDNVNRENFMQDCKNRISEIEKREINSSNNHLDMDGMECSQITRTDMALLECIDRLT